jgi:hypothetical protein
VPGSDRIGGRVAEARHVRASAELCGVDSQSWPERSKTSLRHLSKVSFASEAFAYGLILQSML